MSGNFTHWSANRLWELEVLNSLAMDMVDSDWSLVLELAYWNRRQTWLYSFGDRDDSVLDVVLSLGLLLEFTVKERISDLDLILADLGKALLFLVVELALLELLRLLELVLSLNKLLLTLYLLVLDLLV